MVNQMNLIWVSAMSIYAECHSAIMHDFMNGTSRRCVHLLQFQEFVFAGFSAQWWVHFLLSTWKTKRFEENQVNKMSECYIYIHPTSMRLSGFFHYLWKIILLDTKFGEQFMCLCPPKHLSKSKLSLPLFKPISSTHLFKQIAVLKLLRTSFVSYIWTINY